MRIVDLDLMPYEIEVEVQGYALIKIDQVKEGATAGQRKEITYGYFSRSAGGLESLISLVVRDKIITGKQRMNLDQFFKAYKEESDSFGDKLRKVLGETLK